MFFSVLEFIFISSQLVYYERERNSCHNHDLQGSVLLLMVTIRSFEYSILLVCVKSKERRKKQQQKTFHSHRIYISLAR